jgi:hypothetical protein
MSLLAAEDPTQTHHWLLPETAEIIYGGIASVLIIGALVKHSVRHRQRPRIEDRC